jgi:hypothetical protein
MKREFVFTVMLLVIDGRPRCQEQTKTERRFLTAPLTIEDQGSFFVGGGEEDSPIHASVPRPAAALRLLLLTQPPSRPRSV